MTLLEALDLDVKVAARGVLHHVSLAIGAGEVVGLIGPNGAGKTTLLRALQGLIPRAGGSVSLDGTALDELPLSERSRRIAWLPQEREIAWPISVHNLVALGRLPHRQTNSRLRQSNRNAIDKAMRQVDIMHLAARSANSLSGGERARVLTARALAQEAPLLLADEPAAGLDPGHQIELMQIFRALAGDGKGVLVSMHDLGLASQWCDRIVLLHDGKIVMDDRPANVLTAERLRTVYGIDALIEHHESAGLLVYPIGRHPS
jgi:iron complex transport system ATP-binding protein